MELRFEGSPSQLGQLDCFSEVHESSCQSESGEDETSNLGWLAAAKTTKRNIKSNINF